MLLDVEEIAIPDVTHTINGVVVINPEQPFGGVVVYLPQSAVPIVVSITPPGSGGGGQGPPVPVEIPVTSVFGRLGNVVAVSGDYSLDKIAPPAANWTLIGGIRVKNDNSFQFWNPDQSAWHTLQIHGSSGAEYITIGAGEP